MNKFNLQINNILENKSMFSEQWLDKNEHLLDLHYLTKLFDFGQSILLNENRDFYLETVNKPIDIFKKESVVDFKTFLIELSTKSELQHISEVIMIIEKLEFEDILLLMGQKISSTSIRTIEALPPTNDILTRACFKPYNRFISQIEKQLDKHNGRKNNDFWPNLKGNSRQKEKSIHQLIIRFLNHLDWWNIYCHYQHDYVYEIRLKSGHGMRWTKDGEHFIGFLEPYISYESKPVK